MAYTGWKKDAWNSLRAQRQRCNNPKASDYKYYGGRGIQALCGTQEFFNWWRLHRLSYEEGVKLSVDRLDHDKDYTMDNIQLIPHKDNVIESNHRRAATYVVTNEWGDVLLVGKSRSVLEKFNIAFSTLRYIVRQGTLSKKHRILIKEKEIT